MKFKIEDFLFQFWQSTKPLPPYDKAVVEYWPRPNLTCPFLSQVYQIVLFLVL